MPSGKAFSQPVFSAATGSALRLLQIAVVAQLNP